MTEDLNNPLAYRYSSKEMRDNFSVMRRYQLWRRLWLELAKSQKKLGVKIDQKAITEMQNNLDKINLKKAEKIEQQTNHEVVAHIRLFGEQCPHASKIIHLGATSAFVMDNADLIQIRDGLQILKSKLTETIKLLIERCAQYKELPVVGYTHFQPAQFTTLGKRFSLWLQDLLNDLSLMNFVTNELPFLGSKGAVGTQATQLSVFDFNRSKLKLLDEMLATAFGFKKVVISSGQTYSRQIDSRVAYLLSSITQSASKFSNDLRLLQHTNEVMEPFGKDQVGSSAMPYKQNPVLSERITSLARYTISLSQFCHFTHATQWLERSLDDSAGRRVAIPQSFMATDAILKLYERILKGIFVNKEMIQNRVYEHLPIAASEFIMSLSAMKGQNRQEWHEKLRNLYLNNPTDNTTIQELKKLVPEAFDIKVHIGNAPQQVEELIKEAKKLIS
ncbi:MAG: adenylosuccinate lyase [Planctomycetes bacterium]|nr:adenylosuccinate lyase [Planctomycetota bacterium]